MSKWDWFHEYERDAEARGDKERTRLARLHFQGWTYRETDPDQAYALYDEGHRLARAMNEPWWALFYAYWRLGSLLHFKGDFRRAVELSVANALEVRKPVYEQFPFRFSIFYSLVIAYLGVDPVGYAGEIRKAIECLETDVPRSEDDDYLLAECKREFALEMDDWDGAERAALEASALADARHGRRNAAHYIANATTALCWIAWKRGDMARLAETADVGEQAARDAGHQVLIAEFQLWEAVILHRRGDVEAARRMRRLAVSRVGRLKKTPGDGYFEAQAALHALDGDLPGALAVREKDLADIGGLGMLSYECYVHAERCRLLAKMGRPLDEALAAARAVARRLRDPAPQLAELERIARGEG
jgi:ATP/maltotriose-dependent transcriptional regulator MalT